MGTVTLNDYQGEAFKFAQYGTPIYPFIALGEEAGEVQGKVAKYIRKNKTLPDFADPDLLNDLVKELGDVLWNIAACASELDVTLEDLAMYNLFKLNERLANNTIIGEGDDR